MFCGVIIEKEMVYYQHSEEKIGSQIRHRAGFQQQKCLYECLLRL